MSVSSSRKSLASSMRNSLINRSSYGIEYLNIQRDVIKSTLHEYVKNKNVKLFEQLVRTLRDRTLNDVEAELILNECSLCVSSMGRDVKLLVEVLFSIDWFCRSPRIVELFSKWVLDLLTAHVYHTPMAIGTLLTSLTKSKCIWVETPSIEQQIIYSYAHTLIAEIVSAIPMSAEVLINKAISTFPYFKSGLLTNQAYVHNLLWITRYIPMLTDQLMTLILNRLIIMDANIKSEHDKVEEVFDIDMDDRTDDLIECLDLCMLEVFQWMDQSNPETLSQLFLTYQGIILPTHGTRNVQFIMFYGLYKDVRRMPSFLDSLWQLIPSARVGSGPRLASVLHLTGLLARASFISMNYVKTYMTKMAEWCHSYLAAQELPSTTNSKNPHAVFYSVCQCLFYLIAFKHKELFMDEKDLLFVVSLNLPKIIMCSLNPLKNCHSGIAEAFASITRIHQIVYCHAIMEQNTRRYLRADDNACIQDWFPYDPYLLPKSQKWIKPIYKEYEETLHDEKPVKNSEMCEEDDFLATSPNAFLAKSSFNSLQHIN